MRRCKVVLPLIVLVLSLALLPLTVSAQPFSIQGLSPSAPGETLYELQPTLSWTPYASQARQYVVLIFRQKTPAQTLYRSPEIQGTTHYKIPASVLAWNEKYFFVVEAHYRTAAGAYYAERTPRKYFQTAQAAPIPCSAGGATASFCLAYAFNLLARQNQTIPAAFVVATGKEKFNTLIMLQNNRERIESDIHNSRVKTATDVHKSWSTAIIGGAGPGLDDHHSTAARQASMEMEIVSRLDEPVPIEIILVDKNGARQKMVLLIEPK